jgi:hypothetical protein
MAHWLIRSAENDVAGTGNPECMKVVEAKFSWPRHLHRIGSHRFILILDPPSKSFFLPPSNLVFDSFSDLHLHEKKISSELSRTPRAFTQQLP